MKNQIIRLLFLCVLFSLIHASAVAQNFQGMKKINGVEIYCRITGQGEPMIIIHGGPGLAHNYLYEPFNQLSENFKLIFYDQRGCGKSESIKPGDSLTVDMLVEDIETLRKDLGIDKLNLAGQSWGAILALNYSVRYPENVKKLILLEPGPASSEYLKPFQENILNRLSKQDVERIAELSRKPELKSSPDLFREFLGIRFKAYHFNPETSSRVNFDYMDSSFVAKFFESSAMLGKYLSDFDLYNALSKIKCPVLIIHGDHDPVPVESVERMRDGIKTAKLEIVRDSGHFVHLENPDLYFRLIREFINGRH